MLQSADILPIGKSVAAITVLIAVGAITGYGLVVARVSPVVGVSGANFATTLSNRVAAIGPGAVTASGVHQIQSLVDIQYTFTFITALTQIHLVYRYGTGAFTTRMPLG